MEPLAGREIWPKTMSPKQQLYTFCIRNKLGMFTYKDIPTREHIFKVQLTVSGRTFLGQSSESRNNAQHQAASGALRTLRPLYEHQTSSPSNTETISNILDSINVKLLEFPVLEYYVNNYERDPPTDRPQCNDYIFQRVFEILNKKRTEDIYPCVMLLMEKLKMTLEVTVVRKREDLYICFATLSKSGQNIMFFEAAKKPQFVAMACMHNILAFLGNMLLGSPLPMYVPNKK